MSTLKLFYVFLFFLFIQASSVQADEWDSWYSSMADYIKQEVQAGVSSDTIKGNLKRDGSWPYLEELQKKEESGETLSQAEGRFLGEARNAGLLSAPIQGTTSVPTQQTVSQQSTVTPGSLADEISNSPRGMSAEDFMKDPEKKKILNDMKNKYYSLGYVSLLEGDEQKLVKAMIDKSIIIESKYKDRSNEITRLSKALERFNVEGKSSNDAAKFLAQEPEALGYLNEVREKYAKVNATKELSDPEIGLVSAAIGVGLMQKRKFSRATLLKGKILRKKEKVKRFFQGRRR